MQELNELKNLVIQSLEANGSLSNIRAQIRASVFKVIDTQDTNQSKKESTFAWENIKCSELHESEKGKILLQLVKELLQFYKMEYSLSVFSSEASLREEVIRENLGEKVGINPSRNKPLLWDLLFSNDSKLMENENESGLHKKPEQKKKSDQNSSKQQPDAAGKSVGELNLQQSAVSEQKSHNLGDSQKYQLDDFDQNEQVQEEVDQYEYENNSDMYHSNLKESQKKFQSSGEDIMGASQSQGFDMTVDSLALEDYDYFEDAEEV